MDIETAQNACYAAIARLADAGHRLANEHAHALDALRAEVESLRRQNQALRERVAELEHRCEHTAEVLTHTYTREQMMADGIKAITFGVDPAPVEVKRQVVSQTLADVVDLG